MKNTITNILLSIPVILIVLYFIPFLGVIMIFARNIILKGKTSTTSIIMIITALLIYIPKLINIINKDIVKTIIENEYYTKLINYSNFILITGIIIYLLNIIIEKLINNSKSKLNQILNDYTNKTVSANQKNDYIIKEKQLKAKKTNTVTCKKCGATTIASKAFIKCKYCRTPIENKKWKE